jgi:hypothetical protein
MTPSINAICVNYIYMYSNMINGILIYCNKRWKLFMFFANLIYKYLYTIIGLTYNILQISFAQKTLFQFNWILI